MNLSILIATVPPRKKYLNRLLFNLQKQITENKLENKVEIIVYEDDFENVLGYKKNKLYESAKGKYVVSIDDDDMVSENYCKLICDVIDTHDVDQICIGHRYYHNNSKKWIPIEISKEYKYYSIVFMNLFTISIPKYDKEVKYDWQLLIKNFNLLKMRDASFKMMWMLIFILIFKKTISKCYRHTCHTTPLKKEIAQSVKFTDKVREQDMEWATEIMKKGLIKTEYKIHDYLYYYYYDKNMSINRGKSGRLSIEQKRKKLTEVSNTIRNINWETKNIDKINIRWI